MAVSPIGNVTYINQNMQTSSIQHANAQQRLDFQAMVNLQEMDDKLDEIEEVRPTEETEALDPDREKEKEQSAKHQEEEESEKEEPEEEAPAPPHSSHILDITV
ncbi:hypothetical protein [Wolinella succinogenes]|uniref:hypothetical protein n=1 Tax=Wolinella succinogenes TaxID=844 RepID=UPI00240A422D|nr:hypothetical protein [Wolinella succinogenes]